MAECDRIPVFAVAGPTASGKTALAVSLAKQFGGEVVSCDSMQVYRGLSVSTAKPTPEEMQGVPHHLLDFLPPQTPFSAADYCKAAADTIRDIRRRGKNVFLCGGTGLYMQSLLDNIDFTGSGANEDLRSSLQELAEKEGNEAVWARLHAADPSGAEALHPNNLGRVIRALEIYEETGLTIAEQHARSRRNPSPYRSFILCLDFRDRQNLYARIDRRVDWMLQNGLEAEARAFYEQYGFDGGTARQAIGCKELLPYLRGEISLQQAAETVKRETRHYAKRQLTWFRRMDNVHFLYMDETDDPVAAAAVMAEKFFEKGRCQA